MFSFFRKKNTGHTLDQQLVFQLSKSRIPSWRQVKYIGRYISRPERWILATCIILAVGSLALMGTVFYRQHVELIPKAGGHYIEGAIGNPRYVNPLYASLNDVDTDLEQLIFSRLFKTGVAGEPIPDLAESYELSADGKTYTVRLKPARWETGEAVTVDDVIFTFNLIGNADYKSPLRDRFEGVVIQKVDDATVSFTLKEPYGRFPAMLDFGIMPSALWEGVAPETIPLAELNLKPVGSGPYRLKSLVKNKTGTIRSYTLERNPDYYGEAAHLDEIMFKFFPSPEEMIAALNNGQLNGIAYLPAGLEDTIIAKNAFDYHAIEQPQLTAAFFNLSSKGPIADKTVRQALGAVDRQAVANAVGRAAIPAFTPLPGNQPGVTAAPVRSLDDAKALLENAGWKLRTLTQADVDAAKTAKNAGDIVRLGPGEWRMKENSGLIIPLVAPTSLKPAADNLTNAWKQLGAKVEATIQDDATVRDQTLANKRFDVLLYTEALAGGEPYLFWHTDAPGNISGYGTPATDTLLEEARTTNDSALAADRYRKFQEAFANDAPAVPLYWQAYIYPQTKKLEGFAQTFLDAPSDRLNGVDDWYLKVQRRFKK